MFGLSFSEATLILVVALIVLGPKRLPRVIQLLGQALRTVQRSSSGLREVLEEPLRDVREPIEQMQRDLYRTVHHFERQVQAAATEATTVPSEDLGHEKQPSAETPTNDRGDQASPPAAAETRADSDHPMPPAKDPQP